MKSRERLIEFSPPELTGRSGSRHHENLLGLGQHLEHFIEESRKIEGGRDGGLVFHGGCVAEVSLVDSREQERRVWIEQPSVLAREYRGGAGHRYDEVRLRDVGENGSDEVDDRLFRRAHRPARADDDLNEVHWSFGTLVQFDVKMRGEVVENEVAAVERLQHQDLFLGRLSGRVDRRPEQQQASQHDASESATRAALTQEAWDGTYQVLCSAQGHTSSVEP